MMIGEVCSREVYHVRRNEPLAEAVREMRAHHVGAMIVSEPRGDGFIPVGIVTDRDVVCGQLARGADLFCLTVEDVMTPDPVTIPEECGIEEGLRTMSRTGVRRAPVVNEAGELVGLVSLDDLLPVVAQEVNLLAQLIGKQASRERRI